MPRARDLRVACGLDWGSASPGAVVWGAALPDGEVHLFDELKFQRMTVADVAAQVLEKSKSWHLTLPVTTYADPSIKPWATTQGQLGESIGMTFTRYGVPLIYPSNDRTSGWQRVHEALAVNPATGTPWLTVHPRCRYLRRTWPLQVQAKLNPEDLETDGDDHGMDAVRYLLMGGLRPWSGSARVTTTPVNSMAWWRKMYGDAPAGVLG